MVLKDLGDFPLTLTTEFSAIAMTLSTRLYNHKTQSILTNYYFGIFELQVKN